MSEKFLDQVDKTIKYGLASIEETLISNSEAQTNQLKNIVDALKDLINEKKIDLPKAKIVKKK